MKSGNGDKAKLCLAKYNSAISQSGSETIRNENVSNAHLLGSPHSEVQTLRALEPRVLLDAAALETADTLIESAALRQAENFFAKDDVSGIKSGNFGDDPSSDAALHLSALDDLADASPSDSDSQNIIVFIDRGVADLDDLLSSIDPSYEVVYISGNSDGVEQIAAHLAERTGIDAIHIISHGRSGTLELGNSSLTAGSINGEHADEMAVIRNALSDDADILIYGCNFADGTRGASAVSALVEATGADIAASLDLTGSALLGGDWDLEAVSGEITAIALSPTSWASTLDLAITNIGTGGAGVSGAGVDALAQQILGSGVTINSATYSGGALQAGTFATGAGASFGANILTFGDGAIFSSGTAASVAGPNNQSSFTVNAPGIDGDPQFNALAGNSTFDASFIVINFTPDVPPGASVGDTGRMTMEIVFGSDEYNEYVYGGVNDTLAVIVNGVNQAVVPNGLAIGIDTINDAGTFNPAFGSPALDPNPEHTLPGFQSANASLYTNNETNAFNTQMDGFTITLPCPSSDIYGQISAYFKRELGSSVC